MPGIRGPELIIILVVVLLLFGARKLPELARSIGASAREFRKGIQGAEEEAPGGAQATAQETGGDTTHDTTTHTSDDGTRQT